MHQCGPHLPQKYVNSATNRLGSDCDMTIRLGVVVVVPPRTAIWSGSFLLLEKTSAPLTCYALAAPNGEALNYKIYSEAVAYGKFCCPRDTTVKEWATACSCRAENVAWPCRRQGYGSDPVVDSGIAL